MFAFLITKEERDMSNSGIRSVVSAAGGQVKLAGLLGVTQQSVSLWVRQGFVPVSRVVEIESQFGVPRLELINPRLRATLEDHGGRI
jgi:DNA-binding transcriptional regulator YdaS (Cro superfamily)